MCYIYKAHHFPLLTDSFTLNRHTHPLRESREIASTLSENRKRLAWPGINWAEGKLLRCRLTGCGRAMVRCTRQACSKQCTNTTLVVILILISLWLLLLSTLGGTHGAAFSGGGFWPRLVTIFQTKRFFVFHYDV